MRIIVEFLSSFTLETLHAWIYTDVLHFTEEKNVRFIIMIFLYAQIFVKNKLVIHISVKQYILWYYFLSILLNYTRY